MMRTFFFCLLFAATTYGQTPVDTPLNIPAPQFRMLDTKGKIVRLADYKNKTLIVYFWATWCHYCHKDLPMVNKVFQQYVKDTTVAFLFVDTREKSPDFKNLVQAGMEKHQFDFHVVFDEKGKDSIQNKYYTEFGTVGVPTRFLIDRHSIIRYKYVGYDERLTEEEAAALFIRSIEDTKKL